MTDPHTYFSREDALDSVSPHARAGRLGSTVWVLSPKLSAPHTRGTTGDSRPLFAQPMPPIPTRIIGGLTLADGTKHTEPVDGITWQVRGEAVQVDLL